MFIVLRSCLPYLLMVIKSHIIIIYISGFGEQGWCSGESTRLPPMWPGFDSWCRRHMCVEFVVGSLPCSERFFLRVLRFSPLLKNQHFQIPIRSGTHGHVSKSCYELLSAPWVNKLQYTIYNIEMKYTKNFE